VKKTAARRLDDPHKEFVNLIRENAHRHRVHEVFRDFCELAALALSNTVDRAQYDAREARYLEIVACYEREEVERFPRMLACVRLALASHPHDCLGKLFMALELGDSFRGQFFTPYEVALLMARMTVCDAAAKVEAEGFVTLLEPAVGAGAMVIAIAETMTETGIDYRNALHVTAVDVDATAVHMAYVQFSLLDIPAIVVHGNSLTHEQWAQWFTPAHAAGGWGRRLRERDGRRVEASEPISLVDVPVHPVPVLPVAVALEGTSVQIESRGEDEGEGAGESSASQPHPLPATASQLGLFD